MSQTFHYLGIDVGTGSARVCVIDQHGEVKGLAAEETKTWKQAYGNTLRFEQSTNDIWMRICNATKKALLQNSIDPESVRGIGFDATCSLAVFSGDTDQPVSVNGPDFSDPERNVILWLDHRATEETDIVNKTNHNLLRYVGGTMNVEMEIPKVLWLKRNMPAEIFSTCKFYDLTDALTHIATGNEARSFCSAVCKQGYVPVGIDGSVKGWQEDFLSSIGLEELTHNNFAQIGGVNGVNGEFHSAGELVGRLCEKAARMMGLPAGIPVGSGVIDAYAGWVGTIGAVTEDDPPSSDGGETDESLAFTRLAAVAGTSTCHLAMSPDPVFVQGVWGPYQGVLLPKHWMAEGGQSATGELIQDVLRSHPAVYELEGLANNEGVSIYEFLNQTLRTDAQRYGYEHVSFLAKHFFYYGDLHGNRSPIADPNMAGAVVGLTASKDLSALALTYYGAMEFIALQTRHIVESMNNAGHRIASIFLSGSQAKNPILVSLIATACSMPVFIPNFTDGAVALGAAMLGVKAASTDEHGNTESLWAIMRRLTKKAEKVAPVETPSVKALLDAKYKVYLDQADRQRQYRRSVDEALAQFQS